MAKAGVIAAFTLALGVMTLWGPSMLQAFVPATGRTGHALSARFIGVSDASSQGLPSATIGAATFAMSMVAALTASRLLATRGQRRAMASLIARRIKRPPTGPEPVWGEVITPTAKIDPAIMDRLKKDYEVQEQIDAAIRAQMPFAGGIIGGESAFASGDYNFDPLGLATKFESAVPWFREAEIKHGRISMLAWIGLVVPDIVRIPGPERCYSSANVVEAHANCVGTGTDVTSPLQQVLLFVSLIECCTIIPKAKQGLTNANAGDYQLGLNFLPKDEAKAKEMKLKELKNGRLAMMGFGGAITQAVLSGNGFPWLY